MADTAVAITAGAGTNIDTRTEATNSNHRQVIVIGDPSVNAGVAPVDVTTGLVVNYMPSVDKGSGTLGSATQRVIVDSSQLATLGQAAMAASQPVVIASDQATFPVTPGGNVAHDAVDSGNPIKQGFKATTALSGLTLVASADRTDGFSGVDGVQIVRPHCNLEDIVTGRATDTAGTSTSCIAASGAGVKTYLTSATLANSSASAVTVNLLDGASVKYTLSVPAGSGNNKEFTIPIPGTANTAWNFQSSAAATTITCSMIGFKSKV